MSKKFTFSERGGCPICGDGRSTEKVSLPYHEGIVSDFIGTYYQGRIEPESLRGGRYRILYCDACDFYYQGDILNDEGMYELYEHIIVPEGSLAKVQGARKEYFQGHLRTAGLIGELLPVTTPHSVKVLDFGMGWGHWACAAKALGYDTMGAEISPSRIAYAAENGIRSVDINALPDACIDFVHTDQVFEHVADPRQLVGELARILRLGGVLGIGVPSAENTAKRFKSKFVPGKDELHPLEHINGFTSDALKRLADGAGLKVVGWAEYSTWRRRLRMLSRTMRDLGRLDMYFRKK